MELKDFVKLSEELRNSVGAAGVSFVIDQEGQLAMRVFWDFGITFPVYAFEQIVDTANPEVWFKQMALKADREKETAIEKIKQAMVSDPSVIH